jgi:hypothetical protein
MTNCRVGHRGLCIIGVVLTLSSAPVANADTTTEFQSAVDAARGSCPAFVLDPVLNDAARRANIATDTYINHQADFTPFDDPTPLIQQFGYNPTKAKLLRGYGQSSADAIRGSLLEGDRVLSDCSYSDYGLDELYNADAGYVLTAIVVAHR